MKRIFFTLLAVFCLMGMYPSAQAANETILRVGLAYASTAVSSASLSCTSGFSLGTVSGTTFSPAQSVASTQISITVSGQTYTVTDGSGQTIYTSTGDHLAVHPLGDTAQYAGNDYHGDFVFRADNAKLTVINYVDLEDYVKGVLPYEMSASWHIEALKAQALCARSYALGNLNKHSSYGFDLCNTTNCQVYSGIGRASANSDAAVDQTAGQLLMANGELAVGYFFSSDGGATESNENVWGGTPVSYLRGVIDPYEDASASTKNVWSITLTADQVASKLKSAGYSIGTVASVQVTKRTPTDNVNQVTVTDTSGKSVTIKNDAVRTVFGCNSIRYTITAGSGETNTKTASGSVWVNDAAQTDGDFYAVGADGALVSIGSVSGRTALTASGQETIAVTSSTQPEQPVVADSFTFSGTGWGHSVGMSQYGARSMAELGYSYTDILKFYYTGISISGT